MGQLFCRFSSTITNHIWSVNFALSTGQGIFINNLSTNTVFDTFIGDLPQGSFTNAFPTNAVVVSTFWPTTGDLQSVQGYSVTEGDEVDRETADGSYNIDTFFGGSWSPSCSPRGGESFWYLGAPGTGWGKTLSVW